VDENRDEESGVSEIDPIALLRDQVAGFLSQLDMGQKPRPSKVHESNSEMPGPEWTPAEGWTVRCVDDGVPPPAVFINLPGMYSSGDLIATRTTEARRVAMAILAACDWADGLASGVAQIDSKRTA
jgi:hypothetical protein